MLPTCLVGVTGYFHVDDAQLCRQLWLFIQRCCHQLWLVLLTFKASLRTKQELWMLTPSSATSLNYLRTTAQKRFHPFVKVQGNLHPYPRVPGNNHLSDWDHLQHAEHPGADKQGHEVESHQIDLDRNCIRRHSLDGGVHPIYSTHVLN